MRAGHVGWHYGRVGPPTAPSSAVNYHPRGFLTRCRLWSAVCAAEDASSSACVTRIAAEGLESPNQASVGCCLTRVTLALLFLWLLPPARAEAGDPSGCKPSPFLQPVASHASPAMTSLSFLVPLVLHYALLVLPLGVGLLALVPTRPGRRRQRWIAVAALLAVLGGALVLLQGLVALLVAPDEASWFVVGLGLLPIALGGVSLLRWRRL
jgi:hypothetical protein